MAKISTYPIVSIPTLNDLLIGTDVENLNETKNFSIGDIEGLIGQGYVPYVGATGNVNLGAFNIISSGFIIPGGLATQFVKANGTLDSTVYQPAGNYITQLSGEATALGPGNATVTLNNAAVINKVLTGLTIAGDAIVSTDSILTAFGKVQNQINTLIGGVQYKGTWNAATNTPTLVSSVGVAGNYYVVSVAGNTNLNGITDWNLGDWAIFNGSTWDKVDNTDAVISVNGQIGAVVLTTTNIAEGTNLYYTDGRSRSAISLTTTGNNGASTYNSATGFFNIPEYTLVGLGGVPLTRQITINGVAQDLSADRTYNVGTVTSIATTGPITGGTITGSGTIGITQAGASSDGYLSSSDWNTFNGKQPAIINPVTGTGTPFFLTMWGTPSSIVDSPLSYLSDSFNFQYNSATGGTVNFTNIGLSTYTYSIQMNNFGSPRSTIHSYTDGIIVQLIAGIQVSRVFANGNTVLGTGVADNGHKLEVSGSLFVNTIANALVDTDRFLVSESGVIKYRTGTELLSDIGGVPSSRTLTINGVTQDLSADRTFTIPTHDAVTIGTANGLSLIGQQLSLGLASGSANGALSSTDWATFNSKQNAITLTTIGTNGPATFISSVLNIPNYSTDLTGYVPYTGANQTVNLNTQQLLAGHATFTTNGSTDTLTVNHTSGSGKGINVTKSGNGEGLYINKTSGSGNAATIIGTLEATTLVKTGGTSAQFLKADGSVDSTAYGTVSSVAALTLGTTGTDLSSTVANSTTTPVITLNVPTASAVNRGALSAADWTTFNSKQNAITLTTTGTSGVSTLVGSTLNIPNYSTDLSGYVTLATDQTITGLKTIQRVGAAIDVLNFKIGTDTLYGLKIAYNQNELVGSGEATWSFVNTFNRNGAGFETTPIAFFRGVLVTGERLLSASVNANLLAYYGGNPTGRYPIYAYNTGVQQFASSIIVGETTGVVDPVTGAIADLPAGVVANFKGRVIGSNAVNNNEFATLGQLTSTSRAAISLTTTGTSGPATYSSVTGVLNIPEYQGGVTSFNTRTGAVTLTSLDVTTALGFNPVTDARTLTINGETYDLTANRSWTVGVNPSAREIQTYIATSGQTTFTVTGGYTVGLLDVFINGVRLTSSDFAATNGTTVVLVTPTMVGNIVDIIKYTSGFTNAVSGTGTTNYLPKFTGASTVGNSLFSDNGTNGGFGGANYAVGTDVRSFNISAPLYAGLAFWANNVRTGDIFGYTVTGNLLINADPLNLFSETKIGFGIDGTEKFAIFNNGNVSIGNLPTDNGAKLQVSGYAALTVTGDNTRAISVIGTTNRKGYLGHAFGTLFIQNNNYFNGSAYVFDDTSIGCANITLGQDIAFQTGAANTNPTTKVFITNAGNVGIGTTSPAVKFQINDGTNINLGIKVGQTDSSAVMLNAFNDAVTANIPLEFRASRFGFQNGNVLINTTSDNGERLRLDGRIGIINATVASGNTRSFFVRGAQTVADGGTLTLSLTNSSLVFITENNTGTGALFFAAWASSTIIKISDPSNIFDVADTAGKLCIFKSPTTDVATIRNRLGSSRSITVSYIGVSD